MPNRIRGGAALLVGLAALYGYFILNYASKDKIGSMGLAVSSATGSSLLNAIYHALPLLRFEAPKSGAGWSKLVISFIFSVLATGYIYASSKQANEDVVTDNNIVLPTLAMTYQASYFLPIAAAMFGVWSNLRCDSFRKLKDPMFALLVAVSTAAAVGYIIIACQAAYTLFSEKKAGEMSWIDTAYKPIYGTNVIFSALAHMPFLPLLVLSNMEGITASIACTKDIKDSFTGPKFAVAFSAAAFLGLSAVGTILIANYGGVEWGAALVLALITSIFNNMVSAIKFSQGIVALFPDEQKFCARLPKSWRLISGPGAATTFYEGATMQKGAAARLLANDGLAAATAAGAGDLLVSPGAEGALALA